MANHLTWTPTKKISSSFLPISSAALSESNCTFATTKKEQILRDFAQVFLFSPAGCSPCLNQSLGKCQMQNLIPHSQICICLGFVSQMCSFCSNLYFFINVVKLNNTWQQHPRQDFQPPFEFLAQIGSVSQLSDNTLRIRNDETCFEQKVVTS